MKQILHSFTLRVAMLTTLLVGGFTNGAWADEYELVYTLTPATGSNNAYANSCDVEIDNITWNVTGNASLTPWRIGGKSLNKVDRTVYSKTEISEKISKVELTVGAASSITVNSLSLIVASDADFTSLIDEVSETFAANSTITFEPSTGIEWTNAYYKFTFNVTVSGSSNKFVEFTEAKFYELSIPEANISLDATPIALQIGGTNTRTASTTTEDASISYSSDNTDVAIVNASTGEVTAVAAGSATITATVSAVGYSEASASYTVTVTNLTPVNISSFFPSSNPLVVGNTTVTTVTNDQSEWTAAYTYDSSDEDVATIASDGTITAAGKGTTTITATLNVANDDDTYQTGATSSMSFVLTVNNPSHIVTFSSNGSIYNTTSVEEGESISLPAENPDDVNGYTFQGWVATPIDGTTDVEPEYVTSPVMGSGDVTYYAVFAEEEVSYSESETETTQTLQYDTWTYSKEYNTVDKTSYRMFGNNSYIESAAFDLSLLKKVVVFGGGSFGSISEEHKFTITAGGTEWASKTTTGTSSTAQNDLTSSVSVSGNGTVRVISNCGDGTSTGLRISKVEIYTKKSIVEYVNFCTTVTALPKPVITMADVDMTWGDTDKSVAPSATINGETYAGTFSYSVDKDGLTVAADGKLTSSTPGTYVVTASIVATDNYQAASTTCTVTVGKQDVTLAFADATVRKKTSDASYTQTATATPATYDGTIAYSKESASTSAGATVNASTAAVTFSATGSVVVKATAPATDLFNFAETTYTILIQTDPTIVVEDGSIAYGKTFTVDDELIEGGDVTVSSSNPAIATVDGLVITPLAVGTTTITVATAENDTYVAGEETFTLTVTAPTGSSEKPSTEPTVVFYETFDNCDASGGNDDTWNSISGFGSLKADNSTWGNENGGGASQCARFGTSGKLGKATTPNLALETGIEYTLTFKAGAWDGNSESTTLQLSATNATLDKSSVTMTKGAWTTYTATITEASSGATIAFAGNGTSNSRFFLDEVKITKPGTPITSTSVTTTGGLATYCYQYPLNLDGIEGAKAYKAKSVDGENSKVTLEQITGTIKGGVPFILKADGDDDTFEIPLADESTTDPSGNALFGTLAPTFVAQISGDYTNFAYSKSNECFVKIGDAGNTVPANRAYLPINLNGSSDVKAFTLSFNDADGISTTIAGNNSQDVNIYNLAGQRLSQMQKGINIVNGKKMLVK